MQKRVAILEIGGSHDECILSQLIALKDAGAWVAFCGTKSMFSKNSQFAAYVDQFHEVVLPRTTLGDVRCMMDLNKWFVHQKINVVICNTAQGGHVRNLTLTASKKIKFVGIIHTIKMLEGSFTQNVISRKIKTYFVLNETLKQTVGSLKGLDVHAFYPLNYPQLEMRIEKENNQSWIGIIGGVETRRKDLVGFLEIVQQIPPSVHFYFLGKSDESKAEVQHFKKQLVAAGIENRVHLFDHFISEELMHAYLQQMDGIFPLVHPNTPSAEEYFTRQISGAINVAFAYKTPMMIHEAYQNWEDFQSGVVFYNLQSFGESWDEFVDKLPKLKHELILNNRFSSTEQNKRFASIVLG